ncbi:hypothetical protein BC833DRAFT_77036 [Globomyces pollinis-pini]|nr:hypothetical protein BC833DRAFT_77036 [Globomyces pollinis-pini]
MKESIKPLMIHCFVSKSNKQLVNILNSTFLIKSFPIHATKSYQPLTENEVSIAIGDQIQVYDHRYDGWCWGINLMTQQVGMVPVNTFANSFQFNLCIHLINDSKVPNDLLEYVSTHFNLQLNYYTQHQPINWESIFENNYNHLFCFLGDHSNLDTIKHQLLKNELYWKFKSTIMDSNELLDNIKKMMVMF